MFIQEICHHKILKYGIPILCICLALFALFVTSIRPTHVEIHGLDESGQINLPLEEHTALLNQSSEATDLEQFEMTGSFSTAFLSQQIVNITPDLCITSLRINGMDVNLNQKNNIDGSLCDQINGFDIDLGKYLHYGNNPFKIGLIASVDNGNWIGLSIRDSSFDKLYLFLIDMLMLAIAILLYFFLRDYVHLPREISLLMVLGLLLRILYLSYTPYNERTYDVLEYGGHLDYIRYVANTFHLPNPGMNDAWEYYQAPLYYITAAVIYKISYYFALNYEILLQVLSFLYFMIFLLFGILILQSLCKSKWLFFTSTALLVFWPSGIIHSIRIGNDPMYYMLSALSMYFLMQWIIGKQSKDFYLAALFTALVVTTKLNGVLMLAIFGIFFVSTWLKIRQRRLFLIKTVFLISVVLLALYFSLFRSIETALQDHHFNILVGNITELSNALSVGNSLHNYIYFDINIYVTKPFTDTFYDAGGRQYFWNFFLKSMLFGEFSFPSVAEQFFATILSLILLQMICFFLIGLILNIRKKSSASILMVLWFTLSLLSLIYYRHTYPFSSDGDFRFIFPAIIPFIYFYVSGIQFFDKSKLRFILILEYFLAFLFVAVTCLFFR